MANPIRKGLLILFVGMAIKFGSAGRAFAQETIRISFDGFPVGTVIREQFASAGVHFIDNLRYDWPVVVRPTVLKGGDDRNVANVNAPAGIQFDNSVLSVSIKVAVEAYEVPGAVIFHGDGLNVERNGNYWAFSLPLAPKTWGTFPSTPADNPGSVRFLELSSGNIYGGYNYPSGLYFTDLVVTVVPEPSTPALMIGAFVVAAGIAKMRGHST